MKYTLLSFLFVLTQNINAQLCIQQTNVTYCIDFDQTVNGINNDTFSAAGFQPDPESGQLNSNGILITGLSDGDMILNSNAAYTSGDYARGLSSGGVTTGGIYAFKTEENNIALGIQPGGSDMTSGDIILIAYNNTNSSINKVNISYDFLFYNDQDRSSNLTLSYATDNENYTSLDNTSLTTTSLQSETPSWEKQNVNTSITANVSVNDYLYLKWTTDDAEGSGSRDELAIDNIKILATTDTSTGIDKTISNSIRIFPNPFKNQITIRSEEAINSAQLYNTLGLVTKSYDGLSINSLTINTTNIPSGIYIIKIKLQSGKITTRKISKQ